MIALGPAKVLRLPGAQARDFCARQPGVAWQEVAQKIQECVSEKEQELKAEPSLPQTYIGEQVKDMVVFKH